MLTSLQEIRNKITWKFPDLKPYCRKWRVFISMPAGSSDAFARKVGHNRGSYRREAGDKTALRLK
jgi:hypothetical protein